MSVDPADIFPGRAPKTEAEAREQAADREARAIRTLNRASRHGWSWTTLVVDVQYDETWFKALRRWMFRPAETSTPFITPTWVPIVVSALAERYRFTGPRITRDVPKLGKVRTPFLDMVLSWAAAGGEHAETRAKAIAAVIALARDRQDVEPRVDHFINEYDGP